MIKLLLTGCLVNAEKYSDPGSSSSFGPYVKASVRILYSYLVGCCPIPDLFGKAEPILGEV